MKSLKVITLLFFVFFISPLSAQEAKEPEKDGTDGAQSQGQSFNKQDKPAGTTENKNSTSWLKPIIIKGRRIRTMEKASTTTTVTAKDIEARSDKLLKDVLLQVPGMQVQDEAKGIKTFKMRGYDMSKMAITIDGIPIINAYDGQMDIDNIGIMDVSEIIINRGSSSALYGARGVVGSINIIKKEPAELYANASAEYGEHGNYVASFSNGAPIGNFFYYLSGVYDKQRGYTVSNKLDQKEREKWINKILNTDSTGNSDYEKDKGLRDHENYEKYKLYGKAGYHVTPDLEIGASSFYNNSKMKKNNIRAVNTTNYVWNETDQEYEWSGNKDSFRSWYNTWPYNDDYSVSPYIDYKQGNFNVKANAYYYHETNKYTRYGNREDTDPFNIDAQDLMTWFDSIWTGETYGVNIYPSYRLFDWNRLNFALSYYLANHMKEQVPHDEHATWVIYDYGWEPVRVEYIEANYLTLGLEDEIRIMKNIELTLGVSYDAQDLTVFQQNTRTYTNHVTDGMPPLFQGKGNRKMGDVECAEGDSMIWGTYDSFNPVAGIVYEPLTDFLKFRASGSSKTSFPTLENYTKSKIAIYSGSQYRYVNTKIKPETSYNGNAGFELSLLCKQLIFGSDYFYSRFHDKITRVQASSIEKNSDGSFYMNMDSMELQGAETTLKLNAENVLDIAGMEISLSHTYIHAKNLTKVHNSSINKGNRVEDIPEHKFTFDFRANFKTDTSLIIFGNYQYNQIQYVVKYTPAEDAPWSTDYFRAQRLHDPLKIDIKLSQKIYYDYEVYVMCKNVLDDYGVNPFNPGPGRMWYAGAKVTF